MLCLFFKFVLFECFAVAVCVPESSTPKSVQEEIDGLKFTTKALAVQLEKWSNLFLTSLEPRMASSAALLSSIDNNIKNIQERAHVWDTFQLHVSAWNDQLSTLDRKVDIISKGQEKLMNLDAKVNSLLEMDYKVDGILKKIDENNNAIQNQKNHKDYEVLFGEFAARGMLSSIKAVEQKLDKLLLLKPNDIGRIKSGGEKHQKLGLKCHIPRVIEQLLKDMSSKIDLIFDRTADGKRNEYEVDEYMEGGSGDSSLDHIEFRNARSNYVDSGITCNETIINQIFTEVLSQSDRWENISRNLAYQNKTSCEPIRNDDITHFLVGLKNEYKRDLNQSIGYILSEQKKYLEYFTNNLTSCRFTPSDNTEDNTSVTRTRDKIESTGFKDTTKLSCEDLSNDRQSGTYTFTNNTELNAKNRNYNQRFCLIREDGLWTVIQRRDEYVRQQNFSLSWFDYKNGFGNLETDFWFGNDYINRLSTENDLVLRIELEDFDGNTAWAEYSMFKVLDETKQYQLIVDGYSGNASDSFLSHNNSLFSTIDINNDQAPECCPCAESYGGGWWFNRCLESNLNGEYFKKFEDNGYFKGLIWEEWLGNYSLKKTLMMVKSKDKFHTVDATGAVSEESTTYFAYYEDP